MERREFFKSLTGLTGTLLVSPTLTHTAASTAKLNKVSLEKPENESYWNNLRKQFLLPEDYIYLNTGGLGASPHSVSNKVKEMMDRENTYPSPGHNESDWWRIKEKLTHFLGKDVKKEEIAFTSTATEGINIILNGLSLKKGDVIITSTHEHVALQIPLVDKMQRLGIIIRTFEPDLSNGKNNAKRIEPLMDKQTRLIFTSHVTCTTGQIMPLKEIGRLARKAGVMFAVDGAQAIGQVPVDLKEMGIDFYTASGHKWLLGPKRTGILYVREELRERLKPSIVGAYSNGTFDFDKRQLAYHATSQRYEYGTQNDALILGLETAFDFVKAVGLEHIFQRNKLLSEYCYKGLQTISKKKEVLIFSPKEEMYRSGMITFRFRDKDSTEIIKGLEKERFRVRIVNEAKLDAIRVSFHVYNSMNEVDKLLNALERINGIGV